MLCLTRKPGEAIVIDNAIKVCVIEISPGTVRLGIEAPRDVPVHREEIQQRIENETKSEVQA